MVLAAAPLRRWRWGSSVESWRRATRAMRARSSVYRCLCVPQPGSPKHGSSVFRVIGKNTDEPQSSTAPPTRGRPPVHPGPPELQPYPGLHSQLLMVCQHLTGSPRIVYGGNAPHPTTTARTRGGSVVVVEKSFQANQQVPFQHPAPDMQGNFHATQHTSTHQRMTITLAARQVVTSTQHRYKGHAVAV